MTVVRAPDESRPVPVLDDDVDIDRDRVLVRRAQAGDRGAFDDLYARYYLRLWRFCLKRLQDEHEAEDVVQEAFVRAWRALPGFAGERRFYPWLSVIAAHLCSNVVRKRKRSDPVSELPERDMASFEGCGEDMVMTAQDYAMAARALAQLSPRHRLVLDLREERGWSYQRIADHQGVRVSTVEALLWRARAALKREFAAQSGEGRLAGAVGALAFGLRRLLRAPLAAAERGATAMPSASTFVVGSAALAATAVAGVVVSLVPAATAPAAAGAAGAPLALASPGFVSFLPGASPSVQWAPPAPGPGALAPATPTGAIGAPALVSPVTPGAAPAPLLVAPATPPAPTPPAPVLPAAPSTPSAPPAPDLGQTEAAVPAIPAPAGTTGTLTDLAPSTGTVTGVVGTVTSTTGTISPASAPAL